MADFLGVDKMSRYNRAPGLHSTRCTVELANGDFCDADRAPDMPFAICARHAIQVYRHMHEMVTEVRDDHRSHIGLHNKIVKQVVDERFARDNTANHQVYYVRVGELIKIGTTAQLRQRLSNYPPGSQLLAVERGGEHLESQRHRQFAHLLAERKEWFHPGPDLMDHIAALAK